jgi:hypothetical protein
MSLRVHSGIHRESEDEADRLIYDSIRHITNRELKADVLTPWKERHRQQHEVYTSHGGPVDPSTRIGIFGRAYNSRQTHLNSYDGPTRPIKDKSWDPDLSFGGGALFLSPDMRNAVGVDRLD